MKKKKLYIKRTVAVLSLALAVLLVLGTAQEYFLARLDNDQIRIEGFYQEEQDSLDVCIIGSSECYTGFSSVQAYKETGITSYPFCTESNPIAMAKCELKEILRTQNPQLIIIEINGAVYNRKTDMIDLARIHKAIDSVPLKENKIEAIQTIIPEESRAEFYLPFIKYHGAWDDYKKHMKWAKSKLEMQLRGYSLLKGSSVYATTSIKGAKRDNIIDPAKLQKDNSTEELNTKAEYYLRDLLQYCKDEKLDNVVFARFPHIVDKHQYARFKRTNKAGEIIKEYGFDFINLERNQIDINLDSSKDFYNSEHMSIYGQEKLTKYICSIIQNDYGVKPHELTESQKKNWDDCAEFYDDYIRFALQQTDKKSNKKIAENSDILKQIRNSKNDKT